MTFCEKIGKRGDFGLMQLCNLLESTAEETPKTLGHVGKYLSRS